MHRTITIGQSESGPAKLDIARLITSRVLVTAGSGGGKSWLLRKILEEVSASTQTFVIDPEGEFASLRELRDMVLVGPDGDLPADPRSAGLLARRLMEMNVSAVLDIYELTPPHRREFVANFCTALVDMDKKYWRNLFIAIDEAHEFAPNSKGKDCVSGEPLALLFSKGRKRGYCPIIATQRLAKLSMDVAAESRTRFIGLTTLDLDQKRAADFLGFAKDRWVELRDLSPPGREGEFFASGPALMDRGVIKMRSGKVSTTHPEPGQGRMPDPPEPSKKIQTALAELTDLPRQAAEEAKTLAAATAEIAALKRQLKTMPAKPVVDTRATAAAAQTIKTLKQGLRDAMNLIAKITATGFDKAGIDPTVIQKAVEAAAAQIVKMVETHTAKRSADFDRLKREGNALLLKLQKLLEENPTVEVKVKHNESFSVTPATPTVSRAAAADAVVSEDDEGPLGPMGRAFLIVLAQRPNESLSKKRLLVLANYRSSGDVSKMFARLLRTGMVEDAGGSLRITPAGVSVLGDFDPLPTGVELREKLISEASPLVGAILKAIFAAYPDPITKGQVLEATGYKSSGDVSKAFARIVAAGFVVPAGKAMLRAADELFEG